MSTAYRKQEKRGDENRPPQLRKGHGTKGPTF